MRRAHAPHWEQVMKRLSALMLISATLAFGACTPSAETTAKQFAICEMDAIKNMGYQQGEWSS
jgi:hypothetical protein